MARSRGVAMIDCNNCGKKVIAQRLRGKWRGQIRCLDTVPNRIVQLPLIDGVYSVQNFLCHECDTSTLAPALIPEKRLEQPLRIDNETNIDNKDIKTNISLKFKS